MTDISLYLKINSLPTSIKGQLLDYLDFLFAKNANKPNKVTVHPKAGCMKGTFTMKPDFDEPLEDFKEYMQ